ncbi:RNA-guided endonuclease InsQ/TnpB family protein [Candidatus Methanodesulfokora washburnensis]|uniref:RNA-guided endonuclease InsQ/TnpB family protein n=1 Tax=Candidatus Methanodesulfokora washburnensis TaxID=2478471 RepID=UPI001F28A0F8|nr:transposase [Candidatus Methanodesulfokores washburnensis]
MRKNVQVCVVGKVFKPNRLKVLALNRTLNEYFRLVRWYIGFNSKSKSFLHENCYGKAKELFNLNTALIQTARDKAVEILKGFERNRKDDSILRLKGISMRFDRRCYRFSKTTNVLTPYWLTLSLNRREKVSLPIVFGERQRRRIEEALRGEWRFTTVEMVKHYGEWYAHFTLEKVVEVPDEPETIITIDRGEHNLAVAVAISKSNPNKPMKGQFWRGQEIKRIRGLYGHIRRRLQEKKLLKKVKELKGKERRKVNQQLHIIANQIVAYAKQFPKPVIVMEDLSGIRDNFKRSKKLNRRFHSLPFRRLQTIIEYKALLEGIEVRYLTKKETRNTSKTCHRCGHVAQVKGREFRCPKCGLTYNRDLNACINIAHALTRGMGWGSCEPPEPADEGTGAKPALNAGSLVLQGG